MLERESVDSSLIDGTQTQHESIYFNFIDGIDNVYDWEVKNLINIQKSFYKGLKIKKYNYDIDSLISLHKELYEEKSQDFTNNFLPLPLIKIKKLGKIIIDDNKPNWIGTRYEKFLKFIKPSKKNEYLKNLLNKIKKNLKL